MTIHQTSKSFSNDGQLPGFLAIQKQNKSSSASEPHDTDLFYSENNREWLAQSPLSRKAGVHEQEQIFCTLSRKGVTGPGFTLSVSFHLL